MQESLEVKMNFNKQKFNATLAENGMTKKDLCKILNLNEATIYRKINRNGDFNRTEINKFVEIFGLEKTESFLFDENLQNAR